MRSSTFSHKIGVGLRPHHYSYLEQRPQTEAAWLEATTEDYLNSRGKPFEMLQILRQDYPIAFHGISMNIGNPAGLRVDYLQKLRDLSEQIDPFLVSDHLCWTGSADTNIHELLPLPFTEDSISTIVNNIDFVQNFLRRPLALKNISTYISYRHNEMEEWDFVTEVSRRSGCSLLLDINSIYVNSHNHGFEPHYFLNHVPLDRVAQVHISSSATHPYEIPQPIWELFKMMAPQIRHLPILIERDEDSPHFQELESEVIKAFNILENSHEAERSAESV